MLRICAGGSGSLRRNNPCLGRRRWYDCRSYHGVAYMKAKKIAVTIDAGILERVDRLVKQDAFPSRSRIVQEAVKEKLDRLDRSRLARESAKLDPKEEQRFAEAGL